jgi:trk system potassium uptake protein TrkH
VEYTVIVFMILAGTNFTLLSLFLMRQWGKLLGDPEWRVYLLVLFGVSALVVAYGLWHRDFVSDDKTGEAITAAEVSDGVRYSLFQVVSIMTTTGFGTHDFDKWNSFGRGVLFLLMFVGGCAGSTAGGLKVIRHMLFLKIMRLEVEHAFRPRVVRPLRMGGKPVDDPDLRRNILVYFCLILVIFVFSWMFVVTVEPDTTWGSSKEQHQHKLIDSASGVAATLNNIGPGLGTVGATENYAKFSPLTKLLFIWLMMIGRLEIFSILVLFVPSFWRNR